jgi:hypothetical protein
LDVGIFTIDQAIPHSLQEDCKCHNIMELQKGIQLKVRDLISLELPVEKQTAKRQPSTMSDAAAVATAALSLLPPCGLFLLAVYHRVDSVARALQGAKHLARLGTRMSGPGPAEQISQLTSRLFLLLLATVSVLAAALLALGTSSCKLLLAVGSSMAQQLAIVLDTALVLLGAGVVLIITEAGMALHGLLVSVRHPSALPVQGSHGHEQSSC